MMKRFLGLAVGLFLIAGAWLGGMQPPTAHAAMLNNPIAATTSAQIFRNPIEERFKRVGNKVDLNNSSVLAFRRYRGLYPNLARKVIENAPFDAVEDVLNIPGLSDRELQILKANLDNFVALPSEPALIEGQDRINPGIYK